ncbi:MAG: recombinase family protein, partial [Planctomycetes bacterium]|nr:recombinase family protein [Planctomycetota bacterium]
VLGYDVDRERKRLVVNPEEAELVRHIFQRFTEMGSAFEVAKELNADGYRTKSWVTKKGKLHAGKAWNKAHIYRLLNNRIYLGEVTHKGKHYPGEHEAIVGQDLWDRVHAILEENHRSRGARTRAKTEALLRGIIRCAHCDCAMGPHFSRRRGKQYRYYLCVHASKNGYDTCPTRSLSAGEIEGVVVDQLRRVLRSPEILAQTYREARAQADAQDVQVPDFSEQDVVDALCSLDPIWDHLFPDEQARIVQLLVKQVAVYPDRAEMQIRADGLASLVAELNEEQEVAA